MRSDLARSVGVHVLELGLDVHALRDDGRGKAGDDTRVDCTVCTGQRGEGARGHHLRCGARIALRLALQILDIVRRVDVVQKRLVVDKPGLAWIGIGAGQEVQLALRETEARHGEARREL